MSKETMKEESPSWKLMRAAGRHDVAGILQALDEGADIEANRGRGNTPFLLAVETSTIQEPKALKERGADIHAVDEKGNNALHIAAHWGYTHMIDWLLEIGVDPEVKNKKGQIPAELAEAQEGSSPHYLAAKTLCLHVAKKAAKPAAPAGQKAPSA